MTQPLFVDDNGAIQKVSPEIAQQSGWKPAQRADIENALKVAETESVGGHIKQGAKAAAAGAFDAVTGIPRVISAGAAALTGGEDMLEHVSGDNFLQDIYGVGSELLGHNTTADAASRRFNQQRQLEAKVNPGTETGAYIGGQVAGALATGGGSLASEAGAGATKALGGGFLARQAGRFATGFIEGAPLGMTQAQHDAYVEGRHLTAEQSVAAAGMSGVLGGGIVAGAGAAGEGLSKVFGKVKEGVAAVADKVGSEEGSGWLRKALGSGDEAVNKSVASTLNEPLVSPKVAEYVRDGVRGGDLKAAQRAAHEEATTALADATNEAIATNRKLVDKLDNRAWKLSDVETRAKSFSPEALGETKAAAAAIREDIETTIEGLGKDAKKVGVVQGLRDRLAVQDGIIQGTESPAKAYLAMDQIRRDAAATSKALWNGIPNNPNVDTKALYEAMAQKIGGHYDDSFKFLMDADRWGAQGVAQQEANTARAALIQAEHAALPRFASEVGTHYEGNGLTRKAFEADEGKIISNLQKMGTTEGAFSDRRAAQWLDAAENFSKAAKKYGIGAEDAAAADAVAASANKFRSALSAAKEKVGSIDQAQAFLQKAAGTGGVLSSSTVGGVVGGLPGAAAGAAFGAVMNPAKFLAQRIQFEQMAIKTSERLGAGLDKFFGGMSGSAIGQKAGEIAATTARTARAASVPSVLGAFGTIAKSPELAFEKRREEVITASADNNGGVRSALSQQYGELPTQDPHGFTGAVLTATNALDFLRGKMPAGGPDTESYTPMTTQLKPSKVEIAEWAETYNAINDPLSVVDSLASGEMPSPEAVEAIQAVYPRLFAQIQTETFARLRKMDAAGQEVPVRQRMLLDTLLDLNGAGEPTFSPAFGAKWGQAIGGPQQNQPPPGRSGGAGGSIGKSAATKTLSMIGGS